MFMYTTFIKLVFKVHRTRRKIIHTQKVLVINLLGLTHSFIHFILLYNFLYFKKFYLTPPRLKINRGKKLYNILRNLPYTTK